jgi:uncharacterized protein
VADVLITVGVLSDTHAHLYAPVRAALAGVEHIVHAGDIGSPEVLAALRAIAPVTAVRGNADYDVWAQALPTFAQLELGGVRIAIGHIGRQVREWAETSSTRPKGRGFDVVVFGHSHIAGIENENGVLYLNPGAAGPKRFHRPRTIAKLTIRAGVTPDVHAEIIPVPD